MSSFALRYYYVFKSSEGTVVSVLRGEGAPKLTDGVGGWELTPRPRRKSLTLWKGRAPYACEVPVLFDAHAVGDSVEAEISRLTRMGLGTDFSPPPTVKVEGGLPVRGINWVIADIEWGDDVYWEQPDQGSSYRTRQDATVILWEHNPEIRVSIEAINTQPNLYVVTKAGETLKTIAKAVYGNASRWTEIKEANPSIRDPNNLKVGTRVVYP